MTSGSNVNSRAAVVIRAGDHDWKASAEGNGAVDALFKAVDLALAEVLGGHPRLVAYDVHALAEGPDAEGKVTVGIAPPTSAEGARGDGRFTRRGDQHEHRRGVGRGVRRGDQRDARRGLVGRGGRGGGLPAARGPARTPRDRRRAEFDDEARPIDTTEWFNR